MDSTSDPQGPTAHDAPVRPLHDEEEEREERAGMYLATLFALMLPLLIVLAITLPNSGAFNGDAQSSSTGTGLDSLDVNGQRVETVDGEVPDVEVAGATQDADLDADADAPNNESADEGATGAATAIASEGSDTNVAVVPGVDGEGVDGEGVDGQGVTIAGNTNSTDDSADLSSSISNSETTSTDTPVVLGPKSTTSTTEAATSPSPTTSTTSTPTTSTPTSTSTSTSSTTSTSTSTTTTTSSTTSTSTTTTSTTTTTAAPVEPVDFAQRIDIGRIGETSLQFRFSSAARSTYTASIRSGSTVVATKTGTASADVLINETVQGLTAGTDYTVQVTLNGPPVATSPAVAFRTSGGEPDPVETQVSLSDVAVVEVQATRFQVNYASNICANGSFVIREGGTVVGSNAGQAAGCTTRHLAVPGFWTPALKPNTTYTITITVEANGAGKGDGNTASRTLTVTTGS